MNYQQPDGFPLTVNLVDAAHIMNTSVASLRNYIARDVLKHVGQIPLAGEERRFSVSGLVEIGLLTELVAARLPVAMASYITESLIEFAYSIAILSDKYPFAKKMKNSSAVTTHFDNHPNDWMTGPWGHRELSRPKIAVYFPGEPPFVGMDFADGWGDIENARVKALQSFFRTVDGGLLPSLPVGAPGTPMPPERPANDPSIRESNAVMGTLNITAVLCKIDRGLQEKFGTVA